MSQPREAVAKCLAAAHRVAVTSHLSPDGDGLGSGLALVRALERRGAQAQFLSPDGVPSRYRFLPGSETVRRTSRLTGSWDAVVLVECPDADRCGLQGLSEQRLINIDHHALNADFGEINWVDPSAAAVGEMIFELLSRLEVDLDPEIATLLYTSLVTDTGSFRYSNTTDRTFDIASALVQAGCDPAHVARELYENRPLAYLKLVRDILGSLEQDQSGRIAWISMRARQLTAIRAAGLDTEDLINYPRAIEGVEVALFFKELGKNRVKVSMRSRDRVDVAALAAAFGGGGHKNASGCLLEGTLEATRERILKVVTERLEAV